MVENLPKVWPDEKEAVNALAKDVRLTLGDGMIDLELTDEHIDLAIRKAVDRYRARSSNSMERSFIFLQVQPDQNSYTLPPEVAIVVRVWRRGASGNTPGGTFFDPFSAAFINSIYALPYATGGGDLVTYDFAMQYQEVVGRLFGREVMFDWYPDRRLLVTHRHWRANEFMLVEVWNYKPLTNLLAMPWTRQWLRDYATAAAKAMVAEARQLYSALPAPGNPSLNGDALKQEATAEMERLEEELMRRKDGSPMAWPIIVG